VDERLDEEDASSKEGNGEKDDDGIESCRACAWLGAGSADERGTLVVKLLFLKIKLN
jgi:hypothetical protein